MKKVLDYLISEDLDLSLFFSLSLDENRTRLLGYHTPETEAYLISKGFEKIDYIYKDDDFMVEYQLENIYATLSIESK